MATIVGSTALDSYYDPAPLSLGSTFFAHPFKKTPTGPVSISSAMPRPSTSDPETESGTAWALYSPPSGTTVRFTLTVYHLVPLPFCFPFPREKIQFSGVGAASPSWHPMDIAQYLWAHTQRGAL